MIIAEPTLSNDCVFKPFRQIQMTFPALTLLADDISPFGRVDASVLPQQALMELLVSGISELRLLLDDNEGLRPCTEWFGLRFDREMNVIEIDWRFGANPRSGTIQLSYLPQSMQEVYLYLNGFYGSVDTSALPHGMKCLNINKNFMDGSLNLEQGFNLVVNLPPGGKWHFSEFHFPKIFLEKANHAQPKPFRFAIQFAISTHFSQFTIREMI